MGPLLPQGVGIKPYRYGMLPTENRSIPISVTSPAFLQWLGPRIAHALPRQVSMVLYKCGKQPRACIFKPFMAIIAMCMQSHGLRMVNGLPQVETIGRCIYGMRSQESFF